MNRPILLMCFLLPATLCITNVSAEESLDTLLPPPGWLRRNAEQLGVDTEVRQRLEKLYQQQEPKYHQLRYKVERLASQLYPALAADEIDEERVLRQMQALLEAENELKLYQIRVRISLLSELTSQQRQAARDLARQQPPPTNWRGGIAKKVERVRQLSQQLVDNGRSIEEIQQRMQQVDESFAAGKVAEGTKLLDEVVQNLESSLEP